MSRGRLLGGNLWLYTNFDCNLRCSYCVTESSPQAPRRALGTERTRRLIEEGVSLGFEDIFLTGGEPFILPDIFDVLAFALSRARTAVLTNGILLSGARLDRLASIADPGLTIQVSLDGARPEHNDGYRGEGTWARAVQAIQALVARDVRVAVSTTETPDNSRHLDELRQYVGDLGVAAEDHFVRPLARRGFSCEGLEVGKGSLVPEATVSANGVYWHPLLAPSNSDTLVTDEIFPLSAAVAAIEAELKATTQGIEDAREEFT
jgi:MoaA/NifB/PqqE/SkfB family radical SAM enzyme